MLFKEVFGVDTLLIMCWVHMHRNVVKHLHFLDDEFRDEALDDIDHIFIYHQVKMYTKKLIRFS